MKSTRSHASSSTAAAREGAVLPRPPSAIASLAHRASRRWLPLNGEKLCAEAQRRTGLPDFGDPPLQPGLSILLESLEQEAQLHPLGRLLMRIHLRGLLETRLRLVEAWKRKQDALEAQRHRETCIRCRNAAQRLHVSARVAGRRPGQSRTPGLGGDVPGGGAPAEGSVTGNGASGKPRPACGGFAGSRPRPMPFTRCGPSLRMNAWRSIAIRSCPRNSSPLAESPPTRLF